MGGKSSKKDEQEERLNREIDAQLRDAQESDDDVIKLLLLGAGESGKSTLFRQMIKLYGKGFSKKDRVLFRPMIHNNMLQGMHDLCKQTAILGASFDPKCHIQSEEARAAEKAVLSVRVDAKLTPELATHFETLWSDSGIRATFAERSKFQLMDTIDYFFDDVQRIAEPSYLPTETDLIHCRVRTTGIVENRFVIDDNQFLMVDVGGQRNERKKWIHCFEDVTAVIFVAAISAYDQVLFEDRTVNRADEAIELFHKTTKYDWFQDTSFLLFLNKRDLFEEKIKRVPITVWAHDYEGEDPHDYDEVLQYFHAQFVADVSQKVYVHVTCATDSNNVRAVFGSVKDIIIQQHLQESGLGGY